MGTKRRKPATPPEPFSAPHELALPEQWSVQRKAELIERLGHQTSVAAHARAMAA
jgi:hypothetical protein